MMAGFRVGDLEVKIVTVVREADLFEGVYVDGRRHRDQSFAFGLGMRREA